MDFVNCWLDVLSMLGLPPTAAEYSESVKFQACHWAGWEWDELGAAEAD